ncbi:MAG: hypothetical protein AAF927_06980 [Bacteroidota bacterium]
MSKREKQGKIWVIILLMIPLLTMLGSVANRSINGELDGLSASILALVGILLAIWSLISFAIYLGKLWAHILLILLALSYAGIIFYQFLAIYGDGPFPSSFWTGMLYLILLFLGPILLLFLPAPNAFLRYQREKKSRHLSILEQRVNQIGENE